MKQVLYNVLEYRELEKLIKDTYGIGYNLVANMEYSNDSLYDYSIKKPDCEEWLDFYKDDWNNFLIGNVNHIHASLILLHLVLDGVLPEGEYLIDVSW